ncbi:MAG: IS5 family transposase [Methanomassiliicoccaceae archaeon]|nr:IS5 family transposase [Methanomassiliicoccaceae archaeon]
MHGYEPRIGCHRGSGGIAMAKGDKGGEYKNRSRKRSKNDPKRDKSHDSEGNRYPRKVPWSISDREQIARGRSEAPSDIAEIADAELRAMNENKGRGRRYEIAPIVLAIIWKYYCSFASHTFRSILGWSEEVLEERFGVRIPHYSTMCKYSSNLNIMVSPAADILKGKPLTAAVDSTGIGSRTAGLWRHFIWGSTRGWLKLHALVDIETGIVIAYTVTDDKKGDPSQMLGLVDAAVNSGFVIEKVLADGAYDTYENWNGMDDRGITFIANIRENAKTSPKCPTRSEHVRFICKHGKKEWYEKTGYTMRWKAETAFSSLKKLFGEALRAKSEERLNNELDGKIERYNSYKAGCHV